MSKIEDLKKERRQIIDDINSGRIKPNSPEFTKAAERKREISKLLQNPDQIKETAKTESKKPESRVSESDEE